MPRSVERRTYTRQDCAVFRKTGEPFGGLSNMAPGFPLCVNGDFIGSAEALYQACRFPHLPDIQRMIIGQSSPMTAKMKSKPFRNQSRPDWEEVRVIVMRWCLRVKLVQNFDKFRSLLLETGDRPIVEDSPRDDFWGAVAQKEPQVLSGRNVLGRLLMELREQARSRPSEHWQEVRPAPISDFVLLGQSIGVVHATSSR
jgi:ribA/ribD-fused uncharacterized protein